MCINDFLQKKAKVFSSLLKDASCYFAVMMRHTCCHLLIFTQTVVLLRRLSQYHWTEGHHLSGRGETQIQRLFQDSALRVSHLHICIITILTHQNELQWICVFLQNVYFSLTLSYYNISTQNTTTSHIPDTLILTYARFFSICPCYHGDISCYFQLPW